MSGLALAAWRWRAAGHRLIYALLKQWDRIVTWRRPSRRGKGYPQTRWAEARDLMWASFSSPALLALRAQLAAEFGGRRCIIIGSAPGIRLPEPQPGDRRICVNGSLHVAAQLGAGDVSLLVMNISSLLVSAEAGGSRGLLRGLSAQRVLLVGTPEHERQGRELLAQTGLAHHGLDVLYPAERAAALLQATGMYLGLGRRDERISTGMQAATLAMWAGAGEVVLAGFSMSGGHQYLATKTVRHHVTGDGMFLAEMGRLGRIKTTSAELAAAFDLPLVETR